MPVSLEKDSPLSREEVSEIASYLYGPGKKWYSDLARDLTRIRGTDAAISAAAVHQWMNADNRAPPWWATVLIYRLLAEKRSELMLRAARLQSWIVEIEDNRISPTSRRMLMENDS